MTNADLIARADAALEAADIMALAAVERDAKQAKLMTKQLSQYLKAAAVAIAKRKFG